MPSLSYARGVEFRLLAGLPGEDVRELLAIARRRSFGRDEVVFHRGDAANALHLITSGHFAVRILTPYGQSALLAIHGPGDAFGELALVAEGATRSATVAALEGGETFAVYQEEFVRLQARHPGVNNVLLRLLAEQIRRSNERIVAAHYLDSETRVRWSLGRLAESYATAGDAPTLVPLTQEQIAELAGAARATVNRVLKDEEQRGTVELLRGKVRIVDPAALERRVRGMPHSEYG